MSIRKDLHRVFTAAIWLLSATIATPLLPAGRSAGEPGPRLFAQDPPPSFASRSDLVVLHATDPATVYLSVLARCPGLSLKDVASALYDDRVLVRMLAMRRTLFVVPRALVPVVHHAASLDIAAQQRRQLLPS